MPLNNPKNTVQAAQLPVNKLRTFEGHPFQVKDDAEMEQLVWSILTQGLLTPITVRPLDNNEYEVISGHWRLRACQKTRPRIGSAQRGGKVYNYDTVNL